MPLLDDNKDRGGPDLDNADMERAVDLTVADPLALVSELVETRPGGAWANRVSALLLYLTHKANGDDSVRVGLGDDFATSTHALLDFVSSRVAFRNSANTAYVGIRVDDVVLNSAGVTWGLVTGSPEGVVSAVVGSMRSRIDGGAGTSFYVKESGTGNTGWVAK